MDFHIRLNPKTGALLRKDAKANKRSVSQQAAFIIESAYAVTQVIIDAAKMNPKELGEIRTHGAIVNVSPGPGYDGKGNFGYDPKTGAPLKYPMWTRGEKP